MKNDKAFRGSIFSCIGIFFAAALAIFGASQAFAKDVLVWVYHDFPPFVIDVENREGLSFELADRLTEISDGDYNFQVDVLNRGRINHFVQSDVPGIVLWTNPLWFGDKTKEKFLWSTPLFHDSAAVISPKSAPIDFSAPTDLAGLRMTGVRGHRYAGLDELVADGQIQRIDMGSEEQQVLFVAHGRADVSVLAELAARFYVKSHGLSERVHFSKMPHSTFGRVILVQPQMRDEHAFIEQALKQLAQDPSWQEKLKSFGVQPDRS